MNDIHPIRPIIEQSASAVPWMGIVIGIVVILFVMGLIILWQINNKVDELSANELALACLNTLQQQPYHCRDHFLALGDIVRQWLLTQESEEALFKDFFRDYEHVIFAQQELPEEKFHQHVDVIKDRIVGSGL